MKRTHHAVARVAASSLLAAAVILGLSLAGCSKQLTAPTTDSLEQRGTEGGDVDKHAKPAARMNGMENGDVDKKNQQTPPPPGP